MYNYAKLLGLMKEKNLTQKELAKKIGLRSSTLNQKLNNKGLFKQSEISEMCNILNISDNDIAIYFFSH